jgi:hypothetical protein
MPRGRYGAFAQRKPHGECSKGHEIFEENKLNGTCRACTTAHKWASRNNLFNDDPRAIARANELYAKYRQQAGKDS